MQTQVLSDAEVRHYMQRGRRLRAQMFATTLAAVARGLARPFKAWPLRRKPGPGDLAIGEDRELAGYPAP